MSGELPEDSGWQAGKRRRERFDEDPELYHRARAGYHPELLWPLLDHDAVRPGGWVLEVGCGTGQLTRPLLEAGLVVHALEPGAGLAAIARRELEGHELVVEETRFEDFEPQPGRFDLVTAAQAIHWVAPGTATEKAARALRPWGALAWVLTLDRSQGSPYWLASQPLYDAFFQGPAEPLSMEDKVEEFAAALEASEAFGEIERFACPWVRSFTPAAYRDLLGTHSNVRSLEPSVRGDFLTRMEEIARKLGGVERHFETVVLRATRFPLAVPASPG